MRKLLLSMKFYRYIKISTSAKNDFIELFFRADIRKLYQKCQINPNFYSRYRSWFQNHFPLITDFTRWQKAVCASRPASFVAKQVRQTEGRIASFLSVISFVHIFALSFLSFWHAPRDFHVFLINSRIWTTIVFLLFFWKK
jgi:hypothetical protein